MRFYKGSNHYVVALTCHKVRTRTQDEKNIPINLEKEKTGKYILAKNNVKIRLPQCPIYDILVRSNDAVLGWGAVPPPGPLCHPPEPGCLGLGEILQTPVCSRHHEERLAAED